MVAFFAIFGYFMVVKNIFEFIMKKIQFIFLVSLVFLQLANANTTALSTQDDRRRQNEWQFVSPMPINQLPVAAPVVSQGGAVEMSERELLANTELLNRAMLSALVYNNADNIAVLLPIYRRQKEHLVDKEMVSWAMAVLNTGEGDYFEAVRKYQYLYKKYPDNKMFAVRLGQAYFGNKQYIEAKKLFLMQEADIQAELAPYLQYIEKVTRPNFAAAGNFLSDKNINNAPTDRNLGGGWTASEPESATGIYLNTSVGKRFLLTDGAFLYPEVSANGRVYWDAKHYNEVAVRLSFGIGKQTAKTTMAVTPFVERTDYAGGNKNESKLRHFSDSVGVSFDVNTALSHNVRLNVNTEVAQNTYTSRQHLNGYTASISPTIHASPKWLGGNAVASLGGDLHYVSTRDRDDSYRRIGVRGAIAKEWRNGFGVRGSVGIAQREYLAPMPIFNKIQENDEYNASLSLWHKHLAYKNFVPKLTWQYQKTDSTVQLYEYSKNRVFVEIGGGF